MASAAVLRPEEHRHTPWRDLGARPERKSRAMVHVVIRGGSENAAFYSRRVKIETSANCGRHQVQLRPGCAFLR
jgi:hypothetical protein